MTTCSPLQSRPLCRGLAAGLGLLTGLSALPAGAIVPPEARLLTPHRAVYEVKLSQSSTASGITDITGRLVFEFTGSVCEGFTQNMRFVMNIVNREGGTTVSDSRSSTWEEAGGERFRFNVNNYEDDKQSERTEGNAARDASAGVVKVELAQPNAAKLDLSDTVMFPVQHTVGLLKAAMQGETIFAADLYDGSDKGEKVYFTSSVIGKLHPPGSKEPLEPIANAERLAGVPSWPVTISYYDKGSDQSEGLPLHEMSFRFYQNGVVRTLTIDYGTVVVTGTLSKIEFLPPTTCPEQ